MYAKSAATVYFRGYFWNLLDRHCGNIARALGRAKRNPQTIEFEMASQAWAGETVHGTYG